MALASLAFSSAHAKKIGEIQPALSLTAQRIAALPVGQAAPWANYLTRSLAAMAQDMDTLAQERAALQDIASPPEGSASEKSMPLDLDASWYASAPALAVVANILSFQTPSGGWGKNQARNTAPRPGVCDQQPV